MDYKEIKKKNGEIIVFCDFEEFLPEISGYKNIEEFQSQCPGNSQEYICHCPFCKAQGHTKHKLYIKKDLSLGHCFVCGRGFVHVTNDVRVDYNVPQFFFGLNAGKGIVLPHFTDPRWNLENFKYDFEDSDTKGEDYLRCRHPYLPELAKLFGFKYNNGNIVIPFWYHGEVIYYQIRFTGNNTKIRYFFPPVDNKPCYILDYGQKTRKVILCEGVFDALALLIMAPEYIPIAILGSHISDYQLDFVREYTPTEVVCYLDETELSQELARKVRTRIDYCPIRLIYSDGEDPEECLKRRISRGQDLQWIVPPQENKSGQLNFKLPNYDNCGI